MKQLKVLIALSFLLFIPLKGYCEESASAESTYTDSSITLYILDEVVVTADRLFRPVTISDYGLPVTQFSLREIESVQIENAYELLNQVPGVTYTRSRELVHGMGPTATGYYRTRGIGERPGAGLLIMVDGRPHYMGFWGHPILDNHPVDDVEYVEVIKGPGSVLYGKEAFGGVVNLVTRRPKPGFKTTIDMYGGSYDSRGLRLYHAGGLGKTTYRLNGSIKSTDGERTNSDQETQSASARFTRELSNGMRLEVGGQYRWSEWFDPGPMNSPKTEGDSTGGGEFTGYGADITLNETFGPTHGKVILYADMLENELNADSKNRSENLGIRAYQVWDGIWPGGELRLGMDYEKYGGGWELLDGSNETESSESNIAPYMHLKQSVTPYLKLSGGVRVNFNSKFKTESEPAYRLGISADADDATRIYTSISRAIRTPALAEQYFPYWAGDRSLLKPERMWQIEVGLRRMITEMLTVEACYFYAEGDNMLRKIAPPFPPIVENTGTFAHRGVELSARAMPIKSLFVYSGFAYLNPGGDTAYNSERTLFFELSYIFPKDIKLSLTVDHSAGRYGAKNEESPLPDYTLFHTRLTVPIPELSEQFKGEGFIAVNNITDADEELADGYPLSGRMITVGLSIRHSVK